MDKDGFITGKIRYVREGDSIGKVGNYLEGPNGTTYHLHFDIQVPTKDGWVWVNPYMTLVSAYERLIGGKGIQIRNLPAQANRDAP
jgi:murein DD-endopeptidase MepM/ murein hydrolase activator NlpD